MSFSVDAADVGFVDAHIPVPIQANLSSPIGRSEMECDGIAAEVASFSVAYMPPQPSQCRVASPLGIDSAVDAEAEMRISSSETLSQPLLQCGASTSELDSPMVLSSAATDDYKARYFEDREPLEMPPNQRSSAALLSPKAGVPACVLPSPALGSGVMLSHLPTTFEQNSTLASTSLLEGLPTDDIQKRNVISPIASAHVTLSAPSNLMAYNASEILSTVTPAADELVPAAGIMFSAETHRIKLLSSAPPHLTRDSTSISGKHELSEAEFEVVVHAVVPDESEMVHVSSDPSSAVVISPTSPASTPLDSDFACNPCTDSLVHTVDTTSDVTAFPTDVVEARFVEHDLVSELLSSPGLPAFQVSDAIDAIDASQYSCPDAPAETTCLRSSLTAGDNECTGALANSCISETLQDEASVEENTLKPYLVDGDLAFDLPSSSPPPSSSPLPVFLSPWEGSFDSPPTSSPPIQPCDDENNPIKLMPKDGFGATIVRSPLKRFLGGSTSSDTSILGDRPSKYMRSQSCSSRSTPPNPMHFRAASQARQHKKLAAPFRSPMITGSLVHDGLHAVYATGRTVAQLPHQIPEVEKERQHDLISRPDISVSNRDRTARAAKQFKSPVQMANTASFSPFATSSTFSGVRAVPTIQALQGKVQILKQAIKVKNSGNGSEEEVLENLVKKWTTIGRQAAWAVWDCVKDIDTSTGIGQIRGGWFADENEVDQKRRFDASWGNNDEHMEKKARLGDYGDGVEEGSEQEKQQVMQHTPGVMLRLLGIDPATLGWDEEEGDFVDD